MTAPSAPLLRHKQVRLGWQLPGLGLAHFERLHLGVSDCELVPAPLPVSQRSLGTNGSTPGRETQRCRTQKRAASGADARARAAVPKRVSCVQQRAPDKPLLGEALPPTRRNARRNKNKKRRRHARNLRRRAKKQQQQPSSARRREARQVNEDQLAQTPGAGRTAIAQTIAVRDAWLRQQGLLLEKRMCHQQRDAFLRRCREDYQRDTVKIQPQSADRRLGATPPWPSE